METCAGSWRATCSALYDPSFLSCLVANSLLPLHHECQSLMPRCRAVSETRSYALLYWVP